MIKILTVPKSAANHPKLDHSMLAAEMGLQVPLGLSAFGCFTHFALGRNWMSTLTSPFN